jgi:DNA sulfur modification protein DndD
MHKSDFIKDVEIVIDGDLIDIEFYDQRKRVINKDSLSKGEQQLYATALLKALIDESNIKFPVFIDSPLQKFDKDHARKVVLDFYPNISGQVILFPLLEKEINEQEYNWLLPKIGRTYLIKQNELFCSELTDIAPERLLKEYNKTELNVHQH